MSTFKKGSLVFEFLLLIFLALVIVSVFGYKKDSRLVPLVVAVPTTIICIIVIAGEFSPKLSQIFELDLGRVTEERQKYRFQGPQEHQDRIPWSKIFKLWFWIIGYFVVMLLFGFAVATPLFLLLFLKLYCEARTWVAIVFSLVLFTSIWVMFHLGANIDFFEGVIFKGVLPPL